ncbi:hypothetical protein QEN19_004263 [Hanseniaspora menglaensis]
MLSETSNYGSFSNQSSNSLEEFNSDYEEYDYRALIRKIFYLFTILFVFSVTILTYVGYTFSTELIQLYIEFPQLETLREINNYDEGRLIFIGDVHGESKSLISLTEKINNQFSITHNDKFILLGDFTTKGSHSDKVLNWMQNHESQVECVYGNHEITNIFYYLNQHKDILDSFNKYIQLTQRYFRKHGLEMPSKQKERILALEKYGYIPLDFADNDSGFIPDTNSIKKAQRSVIDQLGDKGMKYIASKCSTVLHFPTLNLVSVHAGLLPTDLKTILQHKEKKDSISKLVIKSLISMKWVDIDDYKKTSKIKFDNAVEWFKLWKLENLKSLIREKPLRNIIKNYKVIYGHNARTGLNLNKRTKGLDTGCTAGGELSALVLTVKNSQIVDETLVSISCNNG